MLSKTSNLLKSHRVTLKEEDARIIDYNEIIAEKIATLSQNLQQSMESEDFDGFAEDFSDGIDAVQVSALLDEDAGNVIKAEPVFDGPSPEELIAEANQKIEEMYQDAQAQAEDIRKKAYDEGSAQGYQDGIAKAHKELEEEREKMRLEYMEKENRLTGVYQQKIEEIEPGLVDILTDIYEHIFQVKISEYREVIVHLIGNALRKTDNSSEYLIHISPEDLPFVRMQKETLMEAGGIVNASVEFIEDVTLKKNQCLIETDGGIFDCSLGVELKELKKQLLLLSYDSVQRG